MPKLTNTDQSRLLTLAVENAVESRAWDAAMDAVEREAQADCNADDCDRYDMRDHNDQEGWR